MYYKLALILTNKTPAECKRLFEQIENNSYILSVFLERNRDGEWPKEFYDYLQKTLPLLTEQQTIPLAQKIILFIETNQTEIRRELSLMDRETITHESLKAKYGIYALPIIKFFGNISSAQAIDRGQLKEVFFLDLHQAVFAGYEAMRDQVSPDALELLLMKEEMEEETLTHPRSVVCIRL